MLFLCIHVCVTCVHKVHAHARDVEACRRKVHISGSEKEQIVLIHACLYVWYGSANTCACTCGEKHFFRANKNRT
jgi:hypothetical protein